MLGFNERLRQKIAKEHEDKRKAQEARAQKFVAQEGAVVFEAPKPKVDSPG